MRHSSRRASDKAKVPYRIKTLFHSVDGTPTTPSKFQLIHSYPNVYKVKGFLNTSEIEYFDKLCTAYGSRFESSFTEADDKTEVISEERTSNHIHLSKAQDRFVRVIEQRAADMVGLSAQCVEPLQIVSYTNGQQFTTHHDAGTLLDDGGVELVLPRRLVTFFVYLNSLPTNQGHTEFPELGLSVQPERGSAVLFSNVLTDGTPDTRTVHRACPVAHGLHKYGVNVWLCDVSMQELAHVTPVYTLKGVKSWNPSRSALALAAKEAQLFAESTTTTAACLSRDDDDAAAVVVSAAKIVTTSTRAGRASGTRGPSMGSKRPRCSLDAPNLTALARIEAAFHPTVGSASSTASLVRAPSDCQLPVASSISRSRNSDSLVAMAADIPRGGAGGGGGAAVKGVSDYMCTAPTTTSKISGEFADPACVADDYWAGHGADDYK